MVMLSIHNHHHHHHHHHVLGKCDSSQACELTGSRAQNPVFFFGNAVLGSPKKGLCFHGCGPRSGKDAGKKRTGL